MTAASAASVSASAGVDAGLAAGGSSADGTCAPLSANAGDAYAGLLALPNARWSLSRLSACTELSIPLRTGYEVALMPMGAALDIEMRELTAGVSAGRFSGYLSNDVRTGQLRVLPDEWVEPGHTPSDEQREVMAERADGHRSFREERAYWGVIGAQRLVDDLNGQGVAARMRDGADDELTVVELLDEPYAREGFCVELRRGESTVVADLSDADELPADLEQRLALVQQMLEQQLVCL
jgi:hypothetical protein